MSTYTKYPRTFHVPWSLGVTNDDKMLKDMSCFNGKYVVITLKMDGENTTLYKDYYHARSLDGRDHPSRSWVKNFHGSIKHDIPEGYRICGENVYAKHSIKYDNLKSYFYCFSIWDDSNHCLSWDDTLEFCDLLGIETVPMFDRFVWDEVGSPYYIKGLSLHDMFGDGIHEGYVIRNSERFSYEDFRTNVSKFVRPNHVQTEQHWMNTVITPNELIKTEP